MSVAENVDITIVKTGDQKIKDHNNAKILQEATISSKKVLASTLDLDKNINTLKSLLLHSSDTDMLNHVNSLICRAINIIHMKSPSSMKFKNRSPITQKIESQQPFSSQRKRSRQTTVRMAKPSTTRKLSIQQSLITDNLITSEEEQKLDVLQLILNHRNLRINNDNDKIELKDLKNNITDEVIDHSAGLLLIKPICTIDAWQHLEDQVKRIRSDWLCNACTFISTMVNMICCDGCNLWFHWNFVGLTADPLDERVCETCSS